MSISSNPGPKISEPAGAGDDMEARVLAVEVIVNYKFKNKKLLEEALSHSSYTGSPSFQRLEFLGDAALGLGVADFMYTQYPTIDEEILTLLRSAYVCTENLARVAIRKDLFPNIRHALDRDSKVVQKFAIAVQKEDETGVYVEAEKAPKILADIVESVAGAIFVDCGRDFKVFWKKFWKLLEPINAVWPLEPEKILGHRCREQGKQLNIGHCKEDGKRICHIHVDGKLIAAEDFNNAVVARLIAAKKALEKLKVHVILELNEMGVVKLAKKNLQELCDKNKWPKPKYSTEGEGPDHAKRYVCSVKIEAEGLKPVDGDEKAKVIDAENSAASVMILSLVNEKYVSATFRGP